MVATASTMLPLGTKAPDFHLQDTEGHEVSLGTFAGAPALLVVFMCNHCPFVVKIRDGLAKFALDYRDQGLAVVGINSNDPANYPDDSPENMKAEVRKVGYIFPYLFDASQEVAKTYRAACTPDFFLFDGERQLVYRGQFDDSRPGNELPVTGADLRRAVDAVLAGNPVPEPQKPSIGCNIKWREGNEPEYFGR